MTKLEAVNQILRAARESNVSALDTAGNSMAAYAETILDAHDERIQAEGWHQNVERDVELPRADATKVALAMTTGAWTAATKRLVDAGAFASYTFAGGDQINVTGGTGVTADWYEIYKRVDDDTIQLVSSISSADAADVAADKIGWENAIELNSDIIDVDSDDEDALLDVVARDGKIYDREDNTFTFDSDLTVRQVRQLAFADLSEKLANYIAAAAAREFQMIMVGNSRLDKFLEQQMLQRRAQAYAEDAAVADSNILTTDHAYRIKGARHAIQYGR